MIDFKKQLDKSESHNSKSLEILGEEFSEEKRKKRKRRRTYIISIVVVILIFAGQIIMSSQSTANWLAEKGIFSRLKYLTPGADKRLKGEINDRINIILLGVGGDGHEGADLSDTNILLSLKPSTQEVAMFSLPRDMVIPIPNVGWYRINYLNAYAEAQKKGSGGEMVVSVLSDILQIPIDYYLRVNFNGFLDVIDELGGIELYVENEINDYSYPIRGQENNPDYYSRFEYLQIKKGWQKMDSSLALKYARSRKSLGIEGSDFARAKRQQNLLVAMKDKLLSRQTLLNPVTVGKLLTKFNKNVHTNLEIWEIIKLWNLFKDTDTDQIINKVFSDAPGGMLYPAISEQGAYILQPISGNFGQIRAFIQEIFDQEDSDVKLIDNNKAPNKPNLDSNSLITNSEVENKDEEDNSKVSENLFLANIVIKNGTLIAGLAKKQADILSDLNFNVSEIGNAPSNDIKESLFYDLSYGQKPEALNIIKANYNFRQVYSFPAWLKFYEDTAEVDFVLVLGENLKDDQ